MRYEVAGVSFGWILSRDGPRLTSFLEVIDASTGGHRRMT